LLTQGADLSEAKIAEEKFDWVTASELRLKKLDFNHGNTSKKDLKSWTAEYEKIIYCLVRASFQSSNPEQFKERIESAIGVCNEAALETRTSEPSSTSQYFTARALLLRSWIAGDPFSRIETLKACLSTVYEAVSIQEQFKDRSSDILGRSLLLLQCLEELWVSETRSEKLEEILERGRLTGMKTIEELEANGLEDADPRSFAEVCCLTAWFCGLGVLFFETFEKRIELLNLRDTYWKKFDSLADELGDPTIIAKSLIYRQEDYAVEILAMRAREQLPKILPSGDNLLIGALYSQILPEVVVSTNWEDPDEIQDTKLALDSNSGEVISRYGRIRPIGIHWECLSYSYVTSIIWYHSYTASPLAIFPVDRRLELTNQAIEILNSSYGRLSKYSHRASIHLGSQMGVSVHQKARLLEDPVERHRLLERAVNISKTAVDLAASVEPHRDWDYACFLGSYAEAQGSLALSEVEHDKKVSMIRGAIETYAKALDHFSQAHGKFRDPNVSFETVGSPGIQEGLQNMWTALYEETGETEALIRRLQILQQEKKSFEELEKPGHLAMIEWKIGSVQSLIGDHPSASMSFGIASNYYLQASKKIPQLGDYYRDCAIYTSALAEIEKAISSHLEDNYMAAAQSYERAKNILENSKTFTDFATHYEGWFYLEQAENLSRNDSVTDIRQSIAKFLDAAKLFSRTSEEIARKISLNWYGTDLEKIHLIATASSFRHDYCLARVQIEEARLHYREGLRLQGINGYTTALNLFEKLSAKSKSVSEVKELKAIVLSCKAWSKTLEAETYASAELFDEAAQFFLKARDLMLGHKTSLVSEGNSRYCTAFKSLLEYKRGSNIVDYISAKSSLEEAATAYSNAGFHRPVGWIKATERMIDAYVYINSALKESNPEIRAKNYAAAEKLLNMAIEIFETEGYASRKTEIDSLRQKMKEEKELALSLNEIFTAPSILSSTESFNVPRQAQNESFGNPERLQSRVQIAINAPKEFLLGEIFEVNIDLINVSRERVLLHRIEEFIPEKFQLLNEETSSRDYDIDKNSVRGRLIFAGKSISPLGVRSVRLKLRALEASVLKVFLNPKIFLSTQSGELFEIMPSSPTFIHAKLALEFKFDETEKQAIFTCLVKAFIYDYMVLKSREDQSGWRTLPQIIHECKLPSFSVYSRKGGVSTKLEELSKRGLIDKRVSVGERGRGGEVLRIRVAYDRDVIKSYVNEKIRDHN